MAHRYSVTKLLNLKFIHTQNNKYQLSYQVIRCMFQYGPGSKALYNSPALSIDKLRSQSLDRCMQPCTRMQCLTCGSKNWLRKRQRVLSGVGRMRLQGIHTKLHASALAGTNHTTLNFLSGNALNFFNLSQGVVCAMAVLNLKWFGES